MGKNVCVPMVGNLVTGLSEDSYVIGYENALPEPAQLRGL
jgi:hypothetical protein